MLFLFTKNPMNKHTSDNSGVLNTREKFRGLLQFVRPYKFRAVCAILALIFTAAIALSMGQGVKLVIDQGFSGHSNQALKQALALMAILIILLSIGTYTRFYLMSWLGERVIADLRLAVFKQLLSLHPSYFEENRSGEINARLTADTSVLQSIIGSAFSMALRSSLTLVGGVIMMFITNYQLALIVLVSLPLVMLPAIFFGRRVRKLSASSQDAVADVGAYASEVIQNIKVVQGFTREPEEFQAFKSEVEKSFAVAKKRISQRALLIASAMLLILLAVSMMLWSGGNDVLQGRISAGDLGAFVFYSSMVAMSFATLAEVYGELQRAAGAADRLLNLLSTESAIGSPNRAQTVPLNQGMQIDIDGLNFSYPSRPNHPALCDVNMRAAPGQVIAIVGESGAGKSTLFELLQRFYDPQSGSIKINGTDIREMNLQELRSLIGIVPQNPALFSADVAHNIRFGDPRASDQQVMDAAKKAHAHEFIEKLPKAYRSYLGENGIRLSGGQKQRIAIARAILKNPPILLLDEATSALDSESEYQVQLALKELMRERTTLVIAHRLSTVMHADVIYLLEKGRVVDRGTHAVLLKNNASYQRLCELQFSEKNSGESLESK